MENYSQEDQSQTSDEELVAQLSVYVEADGNIGYNCDWVPGSAGTIGIGSIFYKLIHDDLIVKIFDEVKAQCVLEHNTEDLADINDTVEKCIQHFSKDDDKDSLVVDPRRVPRL